VIDGHKYLRERTKKLLDRPKSWGVQVGAPMQAAMPEGPRKLTVSEWQILAAPKPWQVTTVLEHRKSAAPLEKLDVLSVQCEGRNRYRVLFDGGQEHVFTVNTDVVPVVSWNTDFRSAMSGNLKPARPLFDLILTFHKNRSNTITVTNP